MARRGRRRKIVRIIQEGKMREKEGNYTREGVEESERSGGEGSWCL